MLSYTCIENKKGDFFMNESFTILETRITPKGSKNEIIGWREDTLIIKTTSPPIDGAANESIIKIISKQIGIKKSDVSIISGNKSRDKKIKIENITIDEIKDKIKGANL